MHGQSFETCCLPRSTCHTQALALASGTRQQPPLTSADPARPSHRCEARSRISAGQGSQHMPPAACPHLQTSRVQDRGAGQARWGQGTAADTGQHQQPKPTCRPDRRHSRDDGSLVHAAKATRGIAEQAPSHASKRQAGGARRQQDGAPVIRCVSTSSRSSRWEPPTSSPTCAQWQGTNKQGQVGTWAHVGCILP